jgi:hypothetical protein
MVDWITFHQPDEADLVGENQAVVATAAFGDLGQVGLGQGRVAHICPRENGGVVMGDPECLEMGA